MVAITQNNSAFECASARLRDDREVAMAAVRRWPYNFLLISQRLCGDRDIAIAAVSQDGKLLQFVCAGLCDDRDVAMVAASQCINALEYASARLRDDRDLIIELVHKNLDALKFASESLRGDRGILLRAAMRYGCEAFRWASAQLVDNLEAMTIFALLDSRCIDYASYRIRGDIRYLLHTVQWYTR